MNKACSSCGEIKRHYAHGLCQKCFKREWHLKSYDSGQYHSYYWEHRDHILKRVKAYRDNPANKEKIANIKNKWRRKNRDLVIQTKRAWKQRKKLEIWIQEVGQKVEKSSTTRDCGTCGMETRPCSLYIFDGRIFCWECLGDLKEISLIPKKKFVFEKVRCPRCGREHPDKRYKNVCVDCRVAEKRKFYEKGGYLAEFPKSWSSGDILN